MADSSGSSSVPEDPPETNDSAPPVDDSRSIYRMIMNAQSKSLATATPGPTLHYNHIAALHRPVEQYRSPAEEEALGKSSSNLGDMSRGALTLRSLPFPLPFELSAGPKELPPDFAWLSESCAGKAAIGIFGGGCMGLIWGVFLGAMSDSRAPVTMIGHHSVPEGPLREQLRATGRATGERAMYWCRQFAFITGVFGGTECLVEKFRGEKDVWNAAMGGCVTGAAMSAKQGPQAMAFGCGGFAAFSLIADQVMESMDMH
jgi:import inner membrane translocase subunit TIM22|uniref:Mitochondrial import inner membrane translocase subunit TIM22 n=1 Tax=Attheya septentrionalis TaxID=420275 RepID=A0A7S2UGH9_9STRA|mmetsp:Transcript_24701/g.44726  ORF Transcript_24701/g.44726 Transcript_24701/m.44726 type:complete len:259 (+) Transcript_24701:105-881(+)|eukprot:CAMPEP_0198304150 /NCGR_PEP_ID=MMETSP1449-20131203/57254_1 /TAXON_ID=420275 /ORGANISM="Attheya septentrionalis, Strain CCMP2084" /LENGTH=258 /DNA_ID=CAMNT_0044006665 /DNA_START=93 /DNA_END=869 /DNA_ORIENTATION=-